VCGVSLHFGRNSLSEPIVFSAYQSLEKLSVYVLGWQIPYLAFL